jgi:hypothetical protein
MTSRATSSNRFRLAAWALVFGAGVLACAVSVPPSGGPEDRTPPAMEATIPAADSAGVDPGSSIRIQFSEAMQRDGFARLVSFSPPVEIARVRWDGNTAIIEPYHSLHPDTTYVVRVSKGYRDERNVVNDEPIEFAFATSARIDSGAVSGTAYFRREPTARAVVRAFILPRDSGFAPEAARADREAHTDPAGEYRLGYLPTNENRVVVWAFEDKDGNGNYDPSGEYGALLADTLVLSALAANLTHRDISIVDPTEPGIVRGQVDNATGVDTVRVSVGLYAESDSVPPAYFTRAGPAGEFEFPRVSAGVYGLVAFLDFAPDSVCGTYPCGPDSSDACREPCVALPDSVRVDPGAEVVIPRFRLDEEGAE